MTIVPPISDAIELTIGLSPANPPGDSRLSVRRGKWAHSGDRDESKLNSLSCRHTRRSPCGKAFT